MTDMAAAYREGRFTSQDGLSLYYRDWGDPLSARLPVLCLAGLTRNADDFDALARRLAPTRRVVALDYRGRGRSEHDPDWHRYVPPWYLIDIGHLLTVANLHRVVVVGTSLGGLLAMALGALRPTVLAGVVLNDVGPDLHPEGLARIAGYVGTVPDLPDLAAAARHLQALFGAAYPEWDEAQWLAEAARVFPVGADGRLGLDYDPAIGRALAVRANAPPDLWPLFRSLRHLPVLAIRGALSDLLSAATFRRMAEAHPGLEAVTVPARGHVPLLDEDVCIPAIDRLLEAAEHAQRAQPAHA